MNNTWLFLDEDCNAEFDKEVATVCARCHKPLGTMRTEGSFFRILIDKKSGAFFRKPSPWNERANNITEVEGMIGTHCFKQTKKFGEFQRVNGEMQQIA